MKNLFQWISKKKIVSIIGQQNIERDGTDIQISSGNVTPSSAGTVTLSTITVAPGQYCVIGDVDLDTNATSGGTLLLSYTDPISTNAVKRRVGLNASGFTELAHDFEGHPFLATYNPSSASSNLTITIAAENAASGSIYFSNVAYVLRKPES